MDKSKLIEAYIRHIEGVNYITHSAATLSKSLKGIDISEAQAQEFINSAEFAKLENARCRYVAKRYSKNWKFGGFKKFYEWFIKNDGKCYYCGTTQEILDSLFGSGKISAKKRSHTAKLQIERKNANGDYSEENCVLACSLCNNAKSDMISTQNYQTYFAKAMGVFLGDLAVDKIKN